MKRCAPFVLICAGVLLTGCSVGNASEQTTESGSTMSSFARPQERPDITGTIQSIEGNQVTVAKVDLPQRATNGNSNAPAGGPGAAFGGGGFGGGGFGGAGGAGGAGGGARFAGGQGGGFGGGAGGPSGAGQRRNGNGNGGQAFANLKTTNVVVTVPVGIPIAESKRENQKMTTIDRSLADLQVGQRVTIWSDNNTAKAVLFTKSQQQN